MCICILAFVPAQRLRRGLCVNVERGRGDHVPPASGMVGAGSFRKLRMQRRHVTCAHSGVSTESMPLPGAPHAGRCRSGWRQCMIGGAGVMPRTGWCACSRFRGWCPGGGRGALCPLRSLARFDSTPPLPKFFFHFDDTLSCHIDTHPLLFFLLYRDLFQRG